ncbi:hypothetical protein CY35_08G135100 [Sphagnum magellanicum]|nr:hypothetical protein CY35_08G135100 [Sphagnum magellanicum]
MTKNSTMMPMVIEMMQNLPIVKTFWKWPTLFVESTKKVYTLMVMTTTSISPCLHVNPKKTSSPGFFVSGIDSLVNANWLTKDHGQAILYHLYRSLQELPES